MKNVIFDLDGTLVDSLTGIEQSVRAAITLVLPEVPMPDLRAVIGPPIATMFARLWPELAPETMERLVAEFREHYVSTGCLASRPFPGVPETLSQLHSGGRRLFVLTNKPAAPTRKILGHLALQRFFTAAHSPDSVTLPFSSKPDGARLLMRAFGLEPETTALVGDGADDAASADSCGFRFIAAGYGYGNPVSKDRIEKFSEIVPVLLKRFP